jgi:molybdopterin/thiamine biosynthesis adenylyltransferase
MFNIEEINRYSRQLMSDDVGIEGQQKIKAAKVLVVGAGGLGCPALQYLAGTGVGTIGIVDFDTVEVHNLHRQILYSTADIGRKKASTAAEKLKTLNPLCNYIVFDALLSEENAPSIIEPFDVVIDGADNFLARYTVNDACVQLAKQFVYGTNLNAEGQLAVFNYKGSKNLRGIYPDPPNPHDVPSCSENGVLGIVPGMVGTMMCDLALKIIMEKEVLANTLLLADFKNYTFQKICF